MVIIKRIFTYYKRHTKKSLTMLLLIFILGNLMGLGLLMQRAMIQTEENLRVRMPAIVAIEANPLLISQYFGMEVAEINNLLDSLPLENLSGDNLTEILERYDVQILGVGDNPIQDTEVLQKQLDFQSQINLEMSLLLENHPAVRNVLNPSVYQIGTNFIFRNYLPEHFPSSWAFPLNPEMDNPDVPNFFLFKGITYPYFMEEELGLIRIVEGRGFNSESDSNSLMEVVLPQSFAQLNGFEVGDVIRFEQLALAPWQEVLAYAPREMEVVGLFASARAIDTGDRDIDYFLTQQLTNLFYVPTPQLLDLIAFEYEQSLEYFKEGTHLHGQALIRLARLDAQIHDFSSILLNDPREMAELKADILALYPPVWQVTDFSNNYQSLASSLENLLWMGSMIQAVAIGASLIILGLVTLLYLKDRKSEIGIYVALGERKIKLVLQYLGEILGIGIVALILSFGSSYWVTQGFLEGHFRSQVLSHYHEPSPRLWDSFNQHGVLEWYSPGTLSLEEMLEMYELNLETEEILTLFSISLGVVVISILLPFTYLLTLNPKQILLE